MSSGGRIVGEFADYSGMLETLRSRVEELQIQGERFEQFCRAANWISFQADRRSSRAPDFDGFYGPAILGPWNSLHCCRGSSRNRTA